MAETIDLLMDAAELGIRQKGYNAVSFRELADDLGIKSASVHYYFRKKEDLGLALVERYSARFFENLNAEASGADTPKEKLVVFCKAYENALRTSDAICLCGVLGAEVHSLPDQLAGHVAGFFAANIDWLEKAFPGDWKPKAKKTRAQQVVATLQGAVMLSNNLKNTSLLEDTVEQLVKDVFSNSDPK